MEHMINLDIKCDVKQYSSTVLKYKNQVLKHMLVTSKEHQSIIDWYIETMEHGVDTRGLMKEYLKVKKNFDAHVKEQKSYKDFQIS